MQLVTYAEAEGNWRAGVLSGSAIVDIEAAARDGGLDKDTVAGAWASAKGVVGHPAATLRSVAQSASERAARGDSFPVEDARLGPPVPDPEKIICVGVNYAAHSAEFQAPVPRTPILFPKFATSLIGPGEAICLPSVSRQIDWEGELAVVIGRSYKSVPVASAMEVVAGRMPFNDVSARDLQMETSQRMAGKALDTFAPCGPSLVSVDEVGDVQDLELCTRVNGEVVQRASTREMIFSAAEIISFVTELMTLNPGDIIATGTPEGVGFRRTPPRFLVAGDVVEVEVEGLGSLTNPVAGDRADWTAEPGPDIGARYGAVSGRA